jgi:glycosyltransferase involved in cell wall biosynthesis
MKIVPFLSIDDLPEAPPGNTGWPWTEGSNIFHSHKIDHFQWPKVSIVTPSFNQGNFLEETIRSILLQGYPNLEYIIIDGGSIDNSVQIIEKYSPWLTYWISKPDKGQSDAINKGMNIASGSIAGWINSDDMLCKDALNGCINYYEPSAEYLYIGDCLVCDINRNILRRHRAKIFNIIDLLNIGEIWRAKGNMIQPEVLFPRTVFQRVGGLNIHNHYVMDYELWGKILLQGIKIKYTHIAFAYFRDHANQKTKQRTQTTDALLNTARDLINSTSVIANNDKRKLLNKLNKYEKKIAGEIPRSLKDLIRDTGLIR